MKHLTSFLIVIASILFCSCSKGDELPTTSNDQNTDEGNNGSSEEDGSSEGNGKILIAYFSRAGENWQVGVVEQGNTAVMASYMKECTGADVFEIVPEIPYTSNYMDMIEVARQETASNARPAIKHTLDNLDSYSIIFIGSPIWNGAPPMIMHTFYEAYPQLADKTIIPFGTHGGSGIGSCETLLRRYFPDATYRQSLGISGSAIRNESSRTTVENWINQLGLSKGSSSQAETEITELIERRNRAMIAKDTITLASMIPEDAVIRHISGQTQTLHEWFSEIINESMRYYNIETRNLVISVSDDSARASFTSVIEARIWGSHGTWSINGNANFAKQNNNWIFTN